MSIDKISKAAKERIHEPVLRSLYDDYEAIGGMDKLSEMLSKVPSRHQSPLSTALETHVTKEKPMYGAEFALAMGLDHPTAASVAASIDMLWALSLVVDDIYDHDEERAGVETSWVQFGRIETLLAAQSGLIAVISHIRRNFGIRSSVFAAKSVGAGVASLFELKKLSLDSPISDFVKNYDKRAQFHAELPIRLTAAIRPDIPSTTLHDAATGLYQINRAGQILNDVRDLRTEDSWQRTSYSDMRSGTPTIALKHVWNSLDPQGKQTFRELFNKSEFTDTDNEAMKSLIDSSDAFSSACDMAEATYCSAKEHFHTAIPDTNYTKAFDAWMKYKLHHLESIRQKDGR